MKRKDIMDLFDDNHQDEIKDVIDHFEDRFNQIRSLLAEITINNIDDIVSAHDIANDVSDDLY